MNRRGFVSGISASVALGSRIPFASAAKQQYIDIPPLFPSSDEIGAGWSLVDSNVILLEPNEAGFTNAYRAFYGGRSG